MEGNVPENQNEAADKKMHAWVVPLSIFYGIILVVIGLVATICQEMRQLHVGGTSNAFVAGFLAYLYIGSALHLVIIITFSSPRRGQHGSRRHMIRRAVDKLKNKAYRVPTVSGTMEGDALPNGPHLVGMRNYEHGTTSNANGSMNELGDPSTSIIPQRNSDTSDSPTTTEDTEISGPRARSNTGTINAENGDNGGMDSGHDGIEEDAFEERIVLSQKTATQGHEGSGFFLRLGCLLFGIGNVVYIALDIHGAERLSEDCQDGHIFPLYLQLIFVVWQTSFLFRYTRTATPRFKAPSRFGLQHVVATNLVIWIMTLMKEINEAMERAEHSSPEESSNGNSSTHESTVTDNCTLHTPTTSEVTPYFYPFVLEYSLIAMSMMVGIYQTLSVRIEVNLLDSLKRAIKQEDKERKEDPEADEFFAHGHNGLFKGALLLAVVIIVIILSSIYDTDGSESVHYIIEMLQYGFIILIDSLQIIAVIKGVWCFRRLETTLGRSNQIDQVLLILSVTGLILLQIFIMFGIIHGLHHESEELLIDRKRILAVELTGNILTIIFAILQSCFILQGLQTHTTCKEYQRNKPGRETVTFLVVANIAMWLYSSFTNELVTYEVSRYYGSAWPIISSLCKPLGLFFRFHSSICYADIWSIAYMAEEGELKYKEF